METNQIDITEYQSYDAKTQELIDEYVSQFTEIQKKAYFIAKEHLGSSFHLVKSNGFLDWKKDKENNKLYVEFKEKYRIPKKYIENVLSKDIEFQIYNTKQQQDKYIKKWLNKSF